MAERTYSLFTYPPIHLAVLGKVATFRPYRILAKFFLITLLAIAGPYLGKFLPS